MNVNLENESEEIFKSPELIDALSEFESAFNRPYYDEPTDSNLRANYYQSINVESLTKSELYQKLNLLLVNTHLNKLNYKPAVHLYPWVDLQEINSQLKLKSIYSGKTYNAQDLIADDFRIDQKREELYESLVKESSFSSMENSQQASLLEAVMPYNCEHVVPQSWFRKKAPMRGDLHHLFACEISCNTFRGNIPFFDFSDFNSTNNERCGKREENKFEPVLGKGASSRATLYFLLRYPGEINRTSKEYTEDRLNTIIDWHFSNPVTIHEKHRNAAIQEKQGNRNPLIDFPEWANKIDFIKGLGD